MGRMDWLRDLKKIYNKIALGNSMSPDAPSTEVAKHALTSEIKRRSDRFALVPSDLYYQSTSVLAFTVDEVVE